VGGSAIHRLDVTELIAAIRTVASGGSAIDPMVVEKVTRIRLGRTSVDAQR
jgi:DNA-binding NarL/FixJ family response regulator